MRDAIRLGQQRLQSRFEKALRAVARDAARREDLRQRSRSSPTAQAPGLRLVEGAEAPGAAAERVRHAQRVVRRRFATTLRVVSPGARRQPASLSGWRILIQRTVFVAERITIECVVTYWPSMRTPSSIVPSVTPVAANTTSPDARSFSRYLRFRSRMPSLSARRALVVVAEHQPRLELAADAAQRRRRQHAFGRAALADIDVDAGRLGIGRGDHARDVAVGDQLHGRAHASGCSR